MALYYYYAMLALSLLLVLVYAFIFHKHFDHNLTILTVLVPILNYGFVTMASAASPEEAIAGLKLTYLGGCFLLVTAMFLIFHICGIYLKSWMRAAIIAVSVGVYSTSLTIGHLDIFYIGMPTLSYFEGAAYITGKHYGPMHTIFYILIGIYYAATIAVIIYSFFKKKQVSRRILVLVVLSVTVAVLGFFGGRMLSIDEIEFLPATYNLGMIIYLIIASRLRLYDASDSVTDSLVQRGQTGFVSFDSRMRYLGSNETAKKMFPELNEFMVDHSIPNEQTKERLVGWVDRFNKDIFDDKHLVERNEKTFLVSVNTLKVGMFYHGYQFLITDDTVNQENIKLIKTYNSQLESEVAVKTKSVVEMQEKLVLGMATMVEGRDNSTGGHIRRTSDVVRLLVDEMKKDENLNLTDEFYNAVIKAAPMHDLGKITIDDAILRKPGKFTPEEYEVMKTHAPEGARIVRQILEGTDDVYFMKIATNVAHYHHEKWDGTGYPDKLSGENIPLEARIMAIADVYDALVSKRVYKERMSFEVANNIITESMGKHFDKGLEKYYIAARAKIEKYYIDNDN